MKVNTDAKKIEELMGRGVDEVIVKDSLEKKLKSGKKLRIKLGIDPTSPNIHLGRSIPLLKLRDFQELGHQVVFIIGDATGVVGDTSDKESERPMLDEAKVKQNMKDYAKQAGKVVDIKKCEVFYNSKWLAKLGLLELAKMANLFGLHEFESREIISKRLKAGKRVSFHELMYPLMQGYDSVMVKADVEIGGTDQRFNLLAGRTIQSYYGQAPQDIVMSPLVEGTDGRKMSSSWGNTINLIDSANDIYGKVMTVPDNLIIKYFTLTTRVPLAEVKEFEKSLASGGNPRDVKMKLAFELVKFYHSAKAAQEAQEYFVSTFSKKETPEEISELKPSAYDIVTVLVEAKFVASKAEARRAIEQGGVKVNGQKVGAQNFVPAQQGDVVQKGKRFFVRIV